MSGIKVLKVKSYGVIDVYYYGALIYLIYLIVNNTKILLTGKTILGELMTDAQWGIAFWKFLAGIFFMIVLVIWRSISKSNRKKELLTRKTCSYCSSDNQEFPMVCSNCGESLENAVTSCKTKDVYHTEKLTSSQLQDMRKKGLTYFITPIVLFIVIGTTLFLAKEYIGEDFSLYVLGTIVILFVYSIVSYTYGYTYLKTASVLLEARNPTKKSKKWIIVAVIFPLLALGIKIYLRIGQY